MISYSITMRLMNEKITLAIIGRGHWGKVYKKTIDGMDNVFLPEQNIYGRNYKNIKKTNINNVDGVIVAASTSAHYRVASFLLTHGFKNLLIEKPLTETYHQARKLQKLLHVLPGSKVIVGHTLLYDPAYEKMKKIAQKKLGKVSRINYFSLKTPPIRNSTLLQDAGSPPIYLFLDFAGKNPIKVSAKARENDNIELTLEFANGLVAVANIGSVYPKRKRGIEIIGRKGRLILNEFINPRELVFIQNSGEKETINFRANRTALELELQEFMNYITGSKKPKTPYYQGLEVVKIIELAEKSLKKGEPVPFG